ncbi:type I restriction endonuclease subunit R [Flavitalea sp. BT771]|uniref:type I restriction endonuclease subunit R n=1 Tax=Flavitalea sp. BT771 TaxID=3063329 RepID=UPI0026E26B8D|nr:type I restriction endonuclease subunit R [Flavitalea sp. BT771]MDO6435637.1 type I restriction endonuclease subunit R [Flavitalea sp. BT771]MDV6224538.1 type I restriction endonuclease subunit R [Flavitalea sp. BT771]
MFHPSFRENDVSQLPALQLLMRMGYTYLSPEEALAARDNKTSNVLLEDILRTQLKAINSIRVGSSKTTVFSDGNIEAGIQALKDLPFQDGYISASQHAYERLTLGKALEQSIDGDKKSFTLQYIDWQHPERNVYHVTEEFEVMRTVSREHLRPDIVLFVNGIPLVVVECKRPDMKDPVAQAISQHTRNQTEDGIRPLYAYSQLLLACATLQAKYATTDTKSEFWSIWKEETKYKNELGALLNQPITAEELAALRATRSATEIDAWSQRLFSGVIASIQDMYIFNLCRPLRLLALIKDYILFEGGRYKKIARYQQYFAIEKIVRRIQEINEGRRHGGVIWHTQGSGKSLTMAMLARRIHQEVRNPKIVLVTDRVDLDTQITETFGQAEVPVHRARTGAQLVELLQSKSDAVVTTVINKFEAAVERLGRTPLASPDIFVLIDEGHRTQYGSFNVKMQKVLPNACFLAFTGTPLMKQEKSTAQKFGGIIDAYTIRQAVEDGAIVPIIYEGRHAVQDVNQKALDRGFDHVAEGLSPFETADLKRKYSRANLIGKTEQRIDEIARDISDHYTHNWGLDRTGERSGFKGMVVTPDKATAIKYKRAFDLIGKVKSEVIISPPDMREGYEDIHENPSDEVITFWKKMETKYGKDFEASVITQFKKTDYPDLLIVVDKLLTGFDEPRVVVMYLCRKLKDHTLLQAIARVNRVAPGKDWGYIIDYEGVLGDLDAAMDIYSSLEQFEAADLEGAVTDIKSIVARLPQVHSELNDIFHSLPNKQDIVSYSNLLADKAIRETFYDKFSEFARCLKLALSSIDFENNTDEYRKNLYKEDLNFFTQLRNAVCQAYSDKVDFSRYEKQLQKLLDQHVTTEEVIRLTEQVSILDGEAFERELQKVIGERAKAETIASRTSRHITERMDEDPVFYKKLSELIQQTIADLRAQRLSEAEALRKLNQYREQAINRDGEDVPQVLKDAAEPIAFYRLGIAEGKLSEGQSIEFAQATDRIIRQYLVVDWQHKLDVIRKVNFYIGEYLIDELHLSIEQAEALADKCMHIAKARYKA